MMAPSEGRTWEAKLVDERNRLLARAQEHLAMPTHAVLENGWQFSVLVDRGGRASYRFRRFNDGAVSWQDFLGGVRRLARVLGAGDWKFGATTDRGAWFECELVAPAEPPAPPPEAA